MSLVDDIPTIGSRFSREFRDLDTRRLPGAPPRLGAAVPPEEKHMNKTQAIIDHLKANATTQEAALKPAQIGAALGGEENGFDASTVAALLRFATKAAANAKLRSEKRGLANYWWWGAPASVDQTPEPATATETMTRPAPPEPADPVLDAIAHIGAPRAIPEARFHADRLRSLAALAVLEGPVADWLRELAGLVEGGAA